MAGAGRSPFSLNAIRGTVRAASATSLQPGAALKETVGGSMTTRGLAAVRKVNRYRLLIPPTAAGVSGMLRPAVLACDLLHWSESEIRASGSDYAAVQHLPMFSMPP